MIDFDYAREQMVDRQLARRGIKDAAVLNAMKTVPRERFVGPEQEAFAYEDGPLAIGQGQTISQPYVVAHMIELAQISPGDRVLEIGAGSGYAAAVVAQIADKVVAVERYAFLAEQATERLAALDYRNVQIVAGDGSGGYKQEAPYSAIIVSAGAPTVPISLKEQLSIDGRLIIPTGKDGNVQRLMRFTRVAPDRFSQEDLGGVMFVPLVGESAGR